MKLKTYKYQKWMRVSIISIMANAQLKYEYMPTSRGGRYLCVQDYLFRVNKRKPQNNWISWRCTTKDCTTDDIVTKHPSNHNPPPVENDIKVRLSTITCCKWQT